MVLLSAQVRHYKTRKFQLKFSIDRSNTAIIVTMWLRSTKKARHLVTAVRGSSDTSKIPEIVSTNKKLFD